MNELSAVLWYELRRTMTPGRVAWWFVLAGFPVLITGLILYANDFSREGLKPLEINATWSGIYYMLVPCVCCALSVFLHTAPAIAAELEQRSWVYLATRPRGIFWLLIGKYVVAVAWSITAAIGGVTVAVLLSQSPSPGQIWFSMARLSALSSMSYAALYLMIGAMFPRRAMVFCVAYTAIVEVFLSMIPAVINRVTVQYRLRSLFVEWLDPEIREEILSASFSHYVLAQGSSLVQILWLLLLSAMFLAVALVVAHKSEFTSAAESDV